MSLYSDLKEINQMVMVLIDTNGNIKHEGKDIFYNESLNYGKFKEYCNSLDPNSIPFDILSDIPKLKEELFKHLLEMNSSYHFLWQQLEDLELATRAIDLTFCVKNALDPDEYLTSEKYEDGEFINRINGHISFNNAIMRIVRCRQHLQDISYKIGHIDYSSDMSKTLPHEEEEIEE